MKKGVKILIFTAIGVIVLGIGVCVLSAAIGGFNLQNFSLGEATELQTELIEIKDSFSSVDVEMQTGDIIFVPSSDSSCSVESVASDKADLSAEVRGGTLYVVCKDSRKWYERINLFNTAKQKLTLTLPIKDYAGLDIRSTTSDIRMPGDFSFENASVRNTTGDIDFAANVKGRQSFEIVTGDLTVSDTQPKELSVKYTTGDMKMSDIQCGSLSVVGTTGDISLSDAVSQGNMEIRLTTGDVDLASCDAKNISVNLTTGDVKGTLLSEKSFDAKATTGDVKVPDTSSGDICEVKVVTGDIHLKVEK